MTDESDWPAADADKPAKPPVKKRIARYMGRAEVAEYLGLKNVQSMTKFKLPLHDAQIGPHKGWLASTIDEWNANRPGRGRWGAR